MKVLEKYDSKKTYMFPNGHLANHQVVLEHFPAADVFTHIVETDVDGQVMYAFQNLSAMRTLYEIDMTLTDDESIAELQRIINLPQETPAVDATQQRIADALQDLVVLSMPDIT